MIREEDLLSLQNAVLELARTKTVPGQKFLRLSEFCASLKDRFSGEAVSEMVKELANEGILAPVSTEGGEESYCVTQEYLSTLAE